MQTDLSIYNSLRPSFIEGVHAVKFNALSAVISRYRDYARSSEQIKAYSGDSLLMRDIASLLDEAPRPITREYQDFTPFLLLLMLSEEFHVVHYVERLVTWYFGYCCVDELRTVCTILSECSYPHHDTLRLRFKNYLREARKTLGMPVECNAAVMLKMLDASYEHLTPADVGEFEELLHLGDDYEFISRVKSNYLASDNVTELAGVCGYSSTITFRRRFQRVFGCSASSWLRQRRIERIGELLRTTHYTLQLMRDIASLLDEAPRPITREYQDFTPFLLLLMLSEEFHVVHYVERLVTWYFGYCCVDELRTVCTILSECSYPHHDTLRLRFKNYLREARKTLGMPVECNAAVMLKMLDASYEHLTPADVGEFEELLHLGDDYEFISRVKSNYLASDNVTELAGVCGYSSTITFRRRFQRVFGCSASSWLRQRRIERIGELLRTTHYTLQEIAYMCGFSAQSHFTDFCKRNMGSNPTSIRQEGRI